MGENYLHKKTNIIFYKLLALGIIFLSLFIYLNLNLYPKLFLIWQIFRHKLDTICGCSNHLSFATHPFIFSTLLLSGVLMLIFLVLAILKILKVKLSTDKFIKFNLKNQRQGLSPKLKKICQSLKLENKIIELEGQNPIIFCFGLLKPKICISTKLVKNLSTDELAAVILHEQHHLTNRAPLKLFLVKIFNKTLFFLPGINLLAKKYITFLELAADEGATNGFRNKVPLARALYKIIKWQKQLIIKNNLAISFFSATLGERVNKLADNNYLPKVKIFTPKLLFNIILIFLIFLSFNIFLNSNKLIFANEQSYSCPSMSTPTVAEQCQKAIIPEVCSMSYDLKNSACQIP